MAEETENTGIVIDAEPRDLAADLRKDHPYLPKVWEGRPGANPAAKNFAWRLTRHLKEGREVPNHEMEWFEKYGSALVLRRHSKITIEEDEFLISSAQTGGTTAQDLGLELLRLLISVRKDHADRIDKLTTKYEDRLEKIQERNDLQNMDIIKIIQKDKYETLGIIKSAYTDSTQAINSSMKNFVPLVESLLKNAVALTEQTGKVTGEYHDKLVKIVEQMQKPGNVELLIMMVLAPMLPILIPAALAKMKIPIPDGFVGMLMKQIDATLNGVEK